MKYLLKIVYRLYKKDILDLAVADFFQDIPKNISEPALNIMSEHRAKLDRWFLYQAYILQRRIPGNPKAVDSLFGMLTQIKLLRHVLDTTRPVDNHYKDEGLAPASRAQEQRAEQLKSDLEKVNKFKKG